MTKDAETREIQQAIAEQGFVIQFNTTQNKAAFLFTTKISSNAVINYTIKENTLEVTVADGDLQYALQINSYPTEIYERLKAFDSVYVLDAHKVAACEADANMAITMAYPTE
jgi:hypothetical protein